MLAERITRPEARRLAEEEFARYARLIADLSDEELARPTDCTRWDVRAMSLHVLGSGEGQASVRELLHQFRRGIPLNKEIDAHHWVDGVNEIQVRERAHLTDQELKDRLAEVGPEAVKGRWRTPPPVRYLPVPFGPRPARRSGTSADRLGAVEISPRRRVHARRVGPPHRCLQRARSRDGGHTGPRRPPRR